METQAEQYQSLVLLKLKRMWASVSKMLDEM